MRTDEEHSVANMQLTKHTTRFTRGEREYLQSCLREAARRKTRGCVKGDYHDPCRPEVLRCPLPSCENKILGERSLKQGILTHCGSYRNNRFTYNFTYPTHQGVRGAQYPLPPIRRILTVAEARASGWGGGRG